MNHIYNVIHDLVSEYPEIYPMSLVDKYLMDSITDTEYDEIAHYIAQNAMLINGKWYL